MLLALNGGLATFTESTKIKVKEMLHAFRQIAAQLFCVSATFFHTDKLCNVPAASGDPSRHVHAMQQQYFIRNVVKAVIESQSATDDVLDQRREMNVELDVAILANSDITNCGTSNLAISYYMCGIDSVDDSYLKNHQYTIYDDNYLTQLLDFLKNTREEGVAMKEEASDDDDLQFGHFPRLVLRLAVGAEEEADPPQQHVVSIVGQPDGTFLWLQSYINQYTLDEWFSYLEQTQGTPYFTFDELLFRLNLLIELMAIEGWTADANDIYFTLFHVDMDAWSATFSAPARQWTTRNRLHTFWKYVCDYPLAPIISQTIPLSQPVLPAQGREHHF